MNDEKIFTIKVTMRKRWIPYFLSMLKYMEYCGAIGRSRFVALYSDGDGDFQPKFEINDVKWEKVEPLSDEDGHRVYDAG